MSIIFKDDVVVDNKSITTFVNDISDGNVVDHNTATDAHNNRFNQYLPLSGGTMTGDIVFQTTDAIRKTNNDLYLALMGSQIYGQGASLILSGKDANLTQANHGDFILQASNGMIYHQLRGTPDGSLTWNGKEIKSMAFPSATAINIPLTVTGAKYTAPANGYISVAAQVPNSAYAELALDMANGMHIGDHTFGDGSGVTLRVLMPVHKGQEISIFITNASVTDAKIIYAEGEV